MMAAMTTVSTMISGGAKGADSIFEQCATGVGHHTLIITTRNCPSCEGACPFVLRANETLQRTYPSVKPYLNKLLERNYHQIAYTEAVYAVGFLSSGGKIEGGTTWACQMFYDKYALTRPLFFYDMKTRHWYQMVNNPNLNGLQFSDRWSPIDRPPHPDRYTKYTGIGSRKIDDNGRQAIIELYHGTG